MNTVEIASLICDTTFCRLCGEENDQGCELFMSEETESDLSVLINRYLPVKVENDGKYPTKICPGCNIQLEATKSFLDLIVEGQAKLRHLYKTQQEKLHRQEKQRLQLEEVLKSVNPTSSVDTYTIESDETGETFLIQIVSQGPLFPPDHELVLKSEGLAKPKRKRGRPPKAPHQPAAEGLLVPKVETVAEEAAECDPPENGKPRRRKKIPTRLIGAIAGKELDKVFKQEGVIDEESPTSDDEHTGNDAKRSEEVIGRLESEDGKDLGQKILLQRTARSKSKKKKRYSCDICGKDFLHHGRYELHKKLHEVEYRCAEAGCKFASEHMEALERHQRDTGHAGLQATEKVDKYGTLQLPSDLKARTPSPEPAASAPPATTPKKAYFCQSCSKPFTCKQNYEVHLKAVHAGERPFVCEICSKRFSYSNTLKIHRLKHTNTSKKAKKSSSTTTTPDGQYRCSSCPKMFRHPSSLQYHRDSEHTNGRRFVCNTCDKPFKHRQLLQRHQLVHTNARPFECDQCQATFKTRPNLIHHTRTVHVGAKSHWCGQCGKAFAHKTALKLHQRWHAGLRPYQCDFCQKAFSQKGNLAEHRRIHTGEKPYNCDSCGRAFTTSSQYKLHKKRHANERPHKCPHCDKCFLHKMTLKCHLRRHLDVKPYKCGECDKSFSEAWALKKHERLHSGEKPYKCDMCERAFADNSNLSKHKRTHYRGAEIIANSNDDSKMVYVTFDKDLAGEGDAIVTYIEREAEPEEQHNSEYALEVLGGGEEEEVTVQLQQLVDQEGNAISLTMQDGQQVKVVTSAGENGTENIQGLLPDGTLVPISLSTTDKSGAGLAQMEDYQPVNSLDKLGEALLPANIEFLTGNDAGKVQFIGDNQNMCLVTTYNIDEYNIQ